MVGSVPSAKPSSRDPFQGHEGHLNETQAAAFDQFKAQLREEGWWKPDEELTEEERNPGLDADGKRIRPISSVDETTLLRFLRARKFDVAAGMHQFSTTEQWRTKNRVEESYENFDVEDFSKSQMVYPQWTGRRDKDGLPLFVFKISTLTKDAVNEYNKDPSRLQPRIEALYEILTGFTLPFCSAIPHATSQPICATTTIVDVADVSLTRFWALRAHMQRASTLATAHHPETLGAIYLVGAPGFFSVVWGWIRNWFDPATVEKIFILSAQEQLQVMSEYIDPENLPQQYGGKLPWAYGDWKPCLDEPAKELLGGEDAPPPGPIRWTKKGLEVYGTGRKDEPKRSTTSDATAVDVANPPYAEVHDVEGAEEKGPAPEPALTNGVLHGEGKGDDAAPDQAWDGAKEHPAAPIKELAEKLEGLTTTPEPARVA